jgi:Predicted metal-binding, possibly nucleic acid-binding protein
MKTFSLRSVKLRSGEEFRDSVDLELTPLEYGGQRYIPVPEQVSAALAISRATTGTLFQLRFAARLHGPCYRCLGDAAVDIPINAREYQATNADTDELRTPYVAEDTLDLESWARDAIALELPEQILCRPDCMGLCAVCGKDLNVEPHEHEEERSDSRWAALAELRDKL